MSIDKANKAAEDFTKSKSKWVRVIAGPGTGKSYCLKKRLTWLVNEDGIKPERILVLTFTSIAVQDLKKDITALGLGNIEVSTLHSLAMRILESEKKQGRLMLDFEVTTMLYDLEPEIGKVQNKRAIRKQIQAKTGMEGLSDEEKKFEASREKWLKQHQGLNLNDVISEVCGILKKNKATKKRWCYDRVLVDEYQDLNVVEQEFVDLLVSARGKLTIIGDDDQSIYEFKGAFPDGIRYFDQKHPTCEDIRFTECRRCPSSIVEKANLLIANNRNRIEKVFTAFPDNQAGMIEVLAAETPSEEIEKLCFLIRKESNNISTGQIVILVPTKSRGRKLYEALRESSIPSVFCFRDAVFDSKENQYNFELLTLAANQEDLISWRYLLGSNSKDRLAGSYKRIRDYVKKENAGLLETLEKCYLGELKIPYTHALISRYGTIKSQVEQIRENPKLLLSLLGPSDSLYAETLSQAIETVWPTNGLSAVRSAVLDAVFSSESAATSQHVRIMSLHAAKGLSAKVVIIMSAVETMIPLANKGSLEEQRRLFYVAITRCKGGPSGQHPGKLVISAFTHSEDGIDEYKQTRFVGEMKI